MTDWPILSTITFLPLLGAFFIFLIRGDEATAATLVGSNASAGRAGHPNPLRARRSAGAGLARRGWARAG